jgi:hypothetical protein
VNLKYFHPLPNKTHKTTVLKISAIGARSCAAIPIKRPATRIGCSCSNFVVAFIVEILLYMFSNSLDYPLFLGLAILISL